MIAEETVRRERRRAFVSLPELFVETGADVFRVLPLLRARDARRETPAPAAEQAERAQGDRGGGDARERA
jgi:hypothetical protein